VPRSLARVFDGAARQPIADRPCTQVSDDAHRPWRKAAPRTSSEPHHTVGVLLPCRKRTTTFNLASAICRRWSVGPRMFQQIGLLKPIGRADSISSIVGQVPASSHSFEKCSAPGPVTHRLDRAWFNRSLRRGLMAIGNYPLRVDPPSMLSIK
jgi:hypothetical protein